MTAALCPVMNLSNQTVFEFKHCPMCALSLSLTLMVDLSLNPVCLSMGLKAAPFMIRICGLQSSTSSISVTK